MNRIFLVHTETGHCYNRCIRKLILRRKHCLTRYSQCSTRTDGVIITPYPVVAMCTGGIRYLSWRAMNGNNAVSHRNIDTKVDTYTHTQGKAEIFYARREYRTIQLFKTLGTASRRDMVYRSGQLCSASNNHGSRMVGVVSTLIGT